MSLIKSKQEIILSNIPQWEKTLSLFEKATGLIASLYITPTTRVAGPFATHPLGTFLVKSGVFELNQVAHRSEIEEMIPLQVQKSVRIKKFADALSIICIPLIIDKELVGVIYAGWVFDHFADPIECDRLGRLFGLSGFDFLQIARIQAPVSPEKLRIYEEMLCMMVTGQIEQLIANQELKQASRVKDEIFSVVSHELKTPLTSMLLSVQMLKNRKISTDKFSEYINRIERNALFQSQLIEELLDASKIMSGDFSIEPSVIDLKSIIDESVHMISNELESKSLKIDFKDYGGNFTYKGDYLKLRQSFWSLLANSVKHTPAGGKISITLSKTYSGYSLSFKDSGVGIDKDYLPKLFETFSREEQNPLSPTAGLGLGLFIVKRIIELHDGSIEVASEGKEKGANVSIFLPFMTPSSQL